jgi:hypothetical protein
MKKIVFFVLSILVLLMVFLVGLDFLYTTTYSVAPARTKFQYFRSLKNQQVDYLFLGSSRVENTIDPAIIMAKTGKRVVNMGFQAAKLSDIYLLLKLVKEYHIKTGKIFIQLDYIYNIENGFSNVLPYQLMPFIRENASTKEYFERHYSQDKLLYYMPFYRYCHFESKIGSRELLANIVQKKTTIMAEQGFYGLEGVTGNTVESLPIELAATNNYFVKIKSFAAKNNLEVVFFCAPFSKNNNNLSYISKLKARVPELYDFSLLIDDETMFHDSYHLNKKGATYFTESFITTVLQ